MAVETGFAESHTDLLTKLHTFVTATMLPAPDRWLSQRNVVTSGQEEIIIRGVGGGTDQIYVGIKAYSDAVTDNYGWILNGFTGFNNVLGFYEQPGSMTATDIPPSVPLLKSVPADPNAIKYWFIASSRSIRVIARTGTVYHQMYLGFGVPYGTPSQWPYPLIVGGSGLTNSSGVPIKQNEVTSQVHAFWKPIDGSNNSTGFNRQVGSLAIKEPGGSYRRPYLQQAGSLGSNCNGTWPYVEDVRGVYGGFLYMRTSLDDTCYNLNPIIMIEGSPANMWGEFEGIRHVTGYNLNSEDTISYSGDTWLCVQNVFRTGDSDMVAYRLV